MQDDFTGHTDGLTSPATAAEVISPNDTLDLAFVTRALYVGQGGYECDAQIRGCGCAAQYEARCHLFAARHAGAGHRHHSH